MWKIILLKFFSFKLKFEKANHKFKFDCLVTLNHSSMNFEQSEKLLTQSDFDLSILTLRLMHVNYHSYCFIEQIRILFHYEVYKC